jgi:hypothetical protein
MKGDVSSTEISFAAIRLVRELGALNQMMQAGVQQSKINSEFDDIIEKIRELSGITFNGKKIKGVVHFYKKIIGLREHYNKRVKKGLGLERLGVLIDLIRARFERLARQAAKMKEDVVNKQELVLR